MKARRFETEKECRERIVAEVCNCFSTFGGGRAGVFPDPLSVALKNKPPMFALGVDVRQVVEFIRNARRQRLK